MQVVRKRQTHRRWFKLAVFLLVYSAFQCAYSAPEKITTPSDDLEEESVSTITKEDEIEIEKAKAKSTTKLFKPNGTNATFLELEERVLATLRPKRNCTPPAIEQFPKPLLSPYARRHGGLLIHVLVAVFTFVGLAIICDEYFVSSLDRICEELKMTPDVAGATFMAAGSSAPELATVVIGVFWAKDDIGVSGVIGSAVFNIMFVISVCALCAGTVSHLNWWPLCRDCFFYAVSILVMLCTIWDGLVYWYEAVIMLVMYVVYCVALRFNTPLERWATSLPLPIKLPTREEQAALVTYKSSGEKPVVEQYATVEGTTQETPLQNTGYSADGAYENIGYNADPAQSWDPNGANSWGDEQVPESQAPVWDPNSAWSDTAPTAPPPGSQHHHQQQQQQQQQQQRQQQDTDQPANNQQVIAQPAAPAGPAQNYYRPKEHGTGVNPLEKPVNGNPWQQLCWAVSYPVHWSARKTMPDCRGRWYPVTFLVSMLWISFYSYFMVWMITIIGATLSIPDTVMGLTFVAAGVSVPDALSSLAVIKEGYGDMAVSNAVGSNVFDILVCLGLPWFIQTTIISRGSVVNVISKGLVYSTLSLFSTVIFLVLATHANGWKLDRKYGAILMVWYLLFITFASLYELNVFGNFHPADCMSDY